MSDAHASGEHGKPVRYVIRLKGHLDERWTAWFAGLTITPEDDGTTLLTGPLVDQAALHGLMKKLRDLGLPLLSLTHLEPEQADAAADSSEVSDMPHNRS